jgi:hypothetical protein
MFLHLLFRKRSLDYITITDSGYMCFWRVGYKDFANASSSTAGSSSPSARAFFWGGLGVFINILSAFS